MNKGPSYVSNEKQETTKIAFDCEKYKTNQKKAMLARHKRDKNDILYVEVGGKIINDFHAARVLLGYRPNLKLELIQEIFPDAEFICGISAKDIEAERQRGDFSIGYDKEVFRLIQGLKDLNQVIKKIIITRIPKTNIHSSVLKFEKEAKNLGFEVIRFYECEFYKANKKIVECLEESPYIKFDCKEVIVVAPGAVSGKFRICLNQIYHEMKAGRTPQYIKIETFPVHNLPISHLLNRVYAAATADFKDKVMIDNKDIKSISYNRDIENFKLLQFVGSIFDDKLSRCIRQYTSPTSIGINYLRDGIVDDLLVQRESAAEIARRFVRYFQEYENKKEKKETVLVLKQILNSIGNIVKK